MAMRAARNWVVPPHCRPDWHINAVLAIDMPKLRGFDGCRYPQVEADRQSSTAHETQILLEDRQTTLNRRHCSADERASRRSPKGSNNPKITVRNLSRFARVPLCEGPQAYLRATGTLLANGRTARLPPATASSPICRSAQPKPGNWRTVASDDRKRKHLRSRRSQSRGRSRSIFKNATGRDRRCSHGHYKTCWWTAPVGKG